MRSVCCALVYMVCVLEVCAAAGTPSAHVIRDLTATHVSRIQTPQSKSDDDDDDDMKQKIATEKVKVKAEKKKYKNAPAAQKAEYKAEYKAEKQKEKKMENEYEEGEEAVEAYKDETKKDKPSGYASVSTLNQATGYAKSGYAGSAKAYTGSAKAYNQYFGSHSVANGDKPISTCERNSDGCIISCNSDDMCGDGKCVADHRRLSEDDGYEEPRTLARFLRSQYDYYGAASSAGGYMSKATTYNEKYGHKSKEARSSSVYSAHAMTGPGKCKCDSEYYSLTENEPCGAKRKSKTRALLLQIFLGWLGAGVFYLGWTKFAAACVVLGLGSFVFYCLVMYFCIGCGCCCCGDDDDDDDDAPASCFAWCFLCIGRLLFFVAFIFIVATVILISKDCRSPNESPEFGGVPCY